MKKLLVFVAVMLVLLTGCAPGTDVEVEVPDTTIRLTSPGPNPQLNQPNAEGRLAGLGQGIIAPVTLIGSFFNENSQIYEVHNNGLEYNLGFMIGVALIFLLLGIFGGRWR